MRFILIINYKVLKTDKQDKKACQKKKEFLKTYLWELYEKDLDL